MHRPTTVCALFLSCLVVTSVSQAEIDSRLIKKAGQLCQKGNRALESGKPEEAKTYYGKAVDAVPTFPTALIGLGRIAMGEKRFEDALASYERAKEGYAQIGASMAGIESRRYADAQRQIASMHDTIANLQASATSNVNIQISQLEGAISQLEAINPPNPTDASEPPGEIYFHIGNALFQLNRIDEALAAWETCRERSPEFPLVYNNLALAYWKLERLAEARTSLDKAAELGFNVNPRFKADLERAAARTESD